jgi:hypothetical protein
MKNDEDKEKIIDPKVNTIFIFYLQMNNNCSCTRFGMQKFIDDMLSISAESATIFVQSSRVFTQSLELWVESLKKKAQSPDVFS